MDMTTVLGILGLYVLIAIPVIVLFLIWVVVTSFPKGGKGK